MTKLIISTRGSVEPTDTFDDADGQVQDGYLWVRRTSDRMTIACYTPGTWAKYVVNDAPTATDQPDEGSEPDETTDQTQENPL